MIIAGMLINDDNFNYIRQKYEDENIKFNENIKDIEMLEQLLIYSKPHIIILDNDIDFKNEIVQLIRGNNVECKILNFSGNFDAFFNSLEDILSILKIQEKRKFTRNRHTLFRNKKELKNDDTKTESKSEVFRENSHREEVRNNNPHGEENDNKKTVYIEKEVIKEVQIEKPIYIEKEVIREVEVEVEKPVYIEKEVEKHIYIEKEVIKEIEVVKTLKGKIIVSLLGTQSRVGVTHSCILLAYNLMKNGYRVAVVENNNNKDLEKLGNCYEHSRHLNEGLNYLKIFQIDFYTNANKDMLGRISGFNYDYIIIDNGTISNCDFSEHNRADVKIIIFGSRAWEQHHLEKVFNLDEELINNYRYLTICDEKTKKDVTEEMDELKVSFLNFKPEPFSEDESILNIMDGFLYTEERKKKTGLLNKLFKSS